MVYVHKEYDKAFRLEPTKLRRLVDEVHSCLETLGDLTRLDNFEVFFSGDRRAELSSVEEVLSLDNSRRQRIKRLVISSSASAPSAPRPEHEIQLDFVGFQPSSMRGSSKAVAISVRSDSIGWANRTLAEVEEQVERTWLYNIHPIFAIAGIFFVVLIILVSLYLSPRFGPYADSMWLTNSDFDHIKNKLGDQHILTDEELREVSTMQLRNLVKDWKPQSSVRADSTRRLFLAVPLCGVLVGLVYLVTCYPSVLFLWGDEVERYEKKVQRRRTVWGIIIAITVVGVLSRFFFEGVSSFL
jgi:hypothetical protein